MYMMHVSAREHGYTRVMVHVWRSAFPSHLHVGSMEQIQVPRLVQTVLDPLLPLAGL